MSRAQIARWALHEAKADYEPVFVAWDAKPQALLDANPLGKLPTIIHHHNGHDHVVSEAAAVCHYLAEMSAPELLPSEEEMANYFRWLFFAAPEPGLSRPTPARPLAGAPTSGRTCRPASAISTDHRRALEGWFVA
jgi:glutathione S-transferase